MDKPHFIQGKTSRYQGQPSAEVARLRKIEKDRDQERVDWFSAQEILLSTPIVIDQPIPAIRGWRLVHTPYPILASLAFPHIWDSPVERLHKSIARKGSTGFWAVKPKGISIVEWYRPDIVGIVELSGRVVEHTHGWRAEVCTIQTLFTSSPQPVAIVESLEQRYQCDVFEGSLSTAKMRLLS